MKKIHQQFTGVFVVLLAVTFLFVSCAKEQKEIVKSGEPAEEVIKIGVIVPLTGKIAFLGEPFLKGIEIAADEINANEENSKKVKLIIEDDRSDPKESVTIAKEFITKEDLDGAIVYSTAASEAVAPIFTENKIPFIALSADTGLPQRHPYAFRSFFNAYKESKRLVGYGKKQRKMKKFALLLPDNSWGQWAFQGAQEVSGQENIIDLRYQFGQNDFKTLLLKAKQAGVDGIVWIGLKKETNIISRQKAELDIKTPFLCGYRETCITQGSLEKVPNKYFEGYILFDFSFSNDFKVKHQIKEENLVDTSFGYDVTQALFAATKACQEVTKDCIYENLPGVKGYPTAINSNGFDETRNMIVNTHLLEFRDGEFVEVE